MKKTTFNGYKNTPLTLYAWDDVPNAKAVVQIIHGMAEHMRRYGELAQKLNAAGYIVIGDDHRAHGDTANGKLGVARKSCFLDTVADEILITAYAKETYRLPVLLFGHSYGSFLTQSYIQRAGDGIIGAVISGSARQSKFMCSVAKSIAGIQAAFCGGEKTGKFLDKLIFGGYNKPFKKEHQDFAWLSRDKERVKAYIADPMCGYPMSINFYYSFTAALGKLYNNKGLGNIPKDLPLLLISGERDPVGGGKLVKKLAQTYRQRLNDIDYKLYTGARHELINETVREEVFADVIDFYERALTKTAR